MKLMRKWIAIGMLLAIGAGGAWAQEATQTPQPGPPPESFSIEGLRIGMTPGEAETVPDLDLREGQSGTYRTSIWHDPFVIVNIDPDGKIRTITVSYRTLKGSWRIKPTGITFESLVKVFTEHWGSPKSNTVSSEELKNIFGTTAATAIKQGAVWVKGTQTAVLTQNRQVSHFPGMYEGSPLTQSITLIIGRDQTPADLAAAQTKAAEDDAATRDKVKF